MAQPLALSLKRQPDLRAARFGAVVAAGLIAGQVLGFCRHAAAAYLLGTGPGADALAAAFAPVELALPALSTAMIFGAAPALITVDIRPIVFRLGAAATVFAAALYVCGPVVVAWFAPGLDAGTKRTAVFLFRILCAAIPALAVTSLLTAQLYARGRFAKAALNQALLHGGALAAALMFFSTFGPATFAAGYAAGAWLQTVLLLRISPGRREGQTGAIGLSRLAQLAAPALCYSGLIALNPVLSRALASTVGPGVTSAFDYALRLTGVPLALFVVPLSSMLVAELARVQTRSDARLATASVLRWATFAGMAAVAAVAFLVAAAPTLIRLAFERGAFHAASTRTAGAVLTGFAPVLVGWTVMDVIGRSLFVLGKPRPAVLTAAFTLSVNAAVSLSLPRATALTIGFGADLGFLLGAAVLMIVLRRSAHDSGVAA